MSTVHRLRGTTISGYTAAGRLVVKSLRGHWSDDAAIRWARRLGVIGIVQVERTTTCFESWDEDLTRSWEQGRQRVELYLLPDRAAAAAARAAARALRLERGRQNLLALIKAEKAAGRIGNAISYARDYRAGLFNFFADP